MNTQEPMVILGGVGLVSETPLAFLMIVMGVVCGASAIALGAPRSVNAFLGAQREGA